MRSAVFFLSLPVLCEQFLNFLVGFVDTLLSGHLGTEVSADATSAVGFSAYAGWLASMLFMLVGTGTTALVARSWGAGDFTQANRITNRSMALAGVLGLIAFAALYALAPIFTTLLKMRGETAALTIRYLRLDAIGLLPMGLSLVGSAALRGAGDMRSPMFIFGLVSILNVIATCSLTYGVGPFPNLGIDTAFVAPMGIYGIVGGTIIARFAGCGLLVFQLSRGLSGLKLVRRELRIRGETVRRILNIGGPAAADGAIMWAGHFLFLIIIARLGEGGMNSAVFAAHIIGVRVEAITYLPAGAWGTAAATIVGQSLGAGDKLRAYRAGHEAVRQCALLGLALTAAFFFGAEAIFNLMHSDPEVRRVGVPAFRILAFFQLPLLVSIVYIMSLRGAGETRFPLFVTIVGMFAVRLPLAYVCGIVLDGGLIGAWIGMCGDMLLRGLLASIRYFSGGWVDTRV